MSRLLARVAAVFDWRPIEAMPRDGSCRMVRCGDDKAVARWDGERFTFPSGRPLLFDPTHFSATAEDRHG